MALYTLERLRSEYLNLWQKMEVRPEKVISATTAAQRIIAHKAKYQAIEQRTGVPWFVVGCMHMRESNCDFNTYLGNGEPLNRRTRLVPKGRGPFSSFDDGAYDALVTVENLDEIKDWGPEHIAYACEKFNGFGYRHPNRNIPSPYLWGGTTVQKKGKFIADGKYDPNVMDTQLGAMAVLRQVMDMEQDARFRTEPVVVPSPLPNEPPPLSPRAEEVETQVKPLSKSKTIWSGWGQWLLGNLTAFGAFMKDNPAISLGFFVASSALLYLVISGRLDVQKIMKHLSQDDTT
jgi:lysozyme family protein